MRQILRQVPCVVGRGAGRGGLYCMTPQDLRCDERRAFRTALTLWGHMISLEISVGFRFLCTTILKGLQAKIKYAERWNT